MDEQRDGWMCIRFGGKTESANSTAGRKVVCVCICVCVWVCVRVRVIMLNMYAANQSLTI